MIQSFHAAYDHTRRFSARIPEIDPIDVRPLGSAGVGLLTGHPVGLVVVAGVILMVTEQLPVARWFFGGSLLLGVAIGVLLWLDHR